MSFNKSEDFKLYSSDISTYIVSLFKKSEKAAKPFFSLQIIKPQIIFQSSESKDNILISMKEMRINCQCDKKYDLFSFSIYIIEFSVLYSPFSLLLSENKFGIVWLPNNYDYYGLYKPILSKESIAIFNLVESSQSQIVADAVIIYIRIGYPKVGFQSRYAICFDYIFSANIVSKIN